MSDNSDKLRKYLRYGIGISSLLIGAKLIHSLFQPYRQLAMSIVYPVRESLYQIIEPLHPELLYYRDESDPLSELYEKTLRRIIRTASTSLRFVSAYATLLGKEEEIDFNLIQAAIESGVLMGLVDDVFDTRSEEDAMESVDFTRPILKQTVKGGFPFGVNVSEYFNKYWPNNEDDKYWLMDKLMYFLYCDMINRIRPDLRLNLARCLLRVQGAQVASLRQKKSYEEPRRLKEISYTKGGYTALLLGCIVDDQLPTIGGEDLFIFSEWPIDVLLREFTIEELRRQFLFELGARVQFLDDRADMEIDEEMEIRTWVKDCIKPENREYVLREMDTRILSLFDYCFKGKIPLSKYWFFRKLVVV